MKINFLKNSLQIFAFFVILLVINYIFYFKNIQCVEIVFISTLLAFLFLISYLISKNSYLKILLATIILYPKKNVGIDNALDFITQKLTIQKEVDFFYFKTIVIPILVICYVFNNRKQTNKIIYLLFFTFLYFLQYFFYILFFSTLKEEPLFFTILGLANFLLFIIISIELIAINQLKLFYTYFSSILICLFILEIIIVQLGFLELYNSYNYRDGFRSIFIGYSVEVSFWALNGVMVSLYKIFIDRKFYFVIILCLSLVLQALVFERTALYLSVICILLFLFRYTKKLFFYFIFAGSVLSSLLYKFYLESTYYQVKSASNDIIGTQSAGIRFYIQNIYIEYMKGHLFLPHGINSSKCRFKENAFSARFLENVVGQESHSIFVQGIFDYGLLIFILSYLLLYNKSKNLKFKFHTYLFIIVVILFFSFQSSPGYYFFLPLILAIFSENKLQSQKHNLNY